MSGDLLAVERALLYNNLCTGRVGVAQAAEPSEQVLQMPEDMPGVQQGEPPAQGSLHRKEGPLRLLVHASRCSKCLQSCLHVEQRGPYETWFHFVIGSCYGLGRICLSPAKLMLKFGPCVVGLGGRLVGSIWSWRLSPHAWLGILLIVNSLSG